jgi:hypothetical protein
MRSPLRPPALLSTLALALLLAGCRSLIPAQDLVLERGDTFQFKEEVTQFGNQEVLVISGLSGHSAYTVDYVDIVRHPDHLQILVHLSANGEAGRSGSFEETVAIPAWAKRVTYGQEEAVIWERARAGTGAE